MNKKIINLMFFLFLFINIPFSFAKEILYATVRGSEYDFNGKYLAEGLTSNNQSKVFPLNLYQFEINALDFIYYNNEKNEYKFKNFNKYVLNISATMRLLYYNKKTGEFKFCLSLQDDKIFPHYMGNDYFKKYINSGHIYGHLFLKNYKKPKFIIKGKFIDHKNGSYEIINSKENEYFDVKLFVYSEKTILLILKKDFPVIVKIQLHGFAVR